MFDALFLLLIIDRTLADPPILVASPYPFNTSESARVRCFTNEQGLLLSLTISADLDGGTSSLRSTEKEISNNGSVTLDIVAPFNYSRFDSPIKCLSKFHHGVEKTTELDVLSVAEIVQQDDLSVKTPAKQQINLHCRTFGSDVAIHWDFTRDPSTTNVTRLPLGIRLERRFTTNDTLIIPLVSLDDHQGYYRCSASNELLGRSYEDQRTISLTVQKSRIWIPIVIVCLVAGLCVLLLILCSRYCQRRRKKVFKASEESISVPVPPFFSSPQFVLGNPFLNAEVQPAAD